MNRKKNQSLVKGHYIITKLCFSMKKFQTENERIIFSQ